jgi:hypothetical protein
MSPTEASDGARDSSEVIGMKFIHCSDLHLGTNRFGDGRLVKAKKIREVNK